MPFIEVNNIENMNGNVSSWVDWLKPLMAVAFGLSIGWIPGWIARRKAVTTAGELAETDINNMKFAIETQILSTMAFIVELQSKDESTKLLSYTNWLKQRFEFIKTVDKVAWVAFRKRATTKEVAIEYVQMIFQALAVLDLQMQKSDEQYVKYMEYADQKVRDYAEIINELNRLAIIERDKLGKDNFKKDKILVPLFEHMFDKKKTLNATVIVNNFETLHPNLRDNVFSDHSHPLYSKIKEFDVKGCMIINDLKNKKLLFINHLNQTIQGLQEAYTQLYSSPYIIPTALPPENSDSEIKKKSDQ